MEVPLPIDAPDQLAVSVHTTRRALVAPKSAFLWCSALYLPA